MSRRRLLLVAAAALTAAAVVPQLAAAAGRDQQSSNWAGYAISDQSTIDGSPITGSATTLSYSSVTGTWTEPRVACTAGDQTYSAFWVGLGGLAVDANALEQVGTAADCTAAGKPVYSAWYELVPAGSVTVKLKISAGDVISASVNVEPNGVLVQVKDRTRGTNFTKLLAVPTAQDYTSAEWIAEAPSSCDALLTHCRALPLANFGKIPFTRIAAIANGHPGTITDPTWASTAIDLVPNSLGGFDVVGASGSATPSAVDATGRSFTVNYAA
jgi:Peptidase A4 family